MAISNYLSKITSQYKNKPKFVAMLTLLFGMADITDLLDNFATIFDIDNAEDDQLDILGEIIGLDRTLPFTPSDGSDPEMNNAVYRIALKAKIIFNNWDGQINTLVDTWNILFPQNKIMIINNQDMSMLVIVLDNYSLMYRDLLENNLLVPHPMGVLSRYYFGNTPVFGYDLNNDFIKGYDLGHWLFYAAPPAFVYGTPGVNQGGYGTGVWS